MDNERYKRQIQMTDIGEEGQKKLSSSKVLVVGAGGLSTVCTMCLAGLGVGTIGIIDGDEVKKTNLNRQFLYKENDIGKKKAPLAKKFLNELNSDIVVEAYDEMLTIDNVDFYVKKYDFIIITTDNMQSRYIVNDSCIRNDKIFINGAVEGYYGTIQVVEPKKSACLRCVYQGEIDNITEKDAISTGTSIISSVLADVLLMLIIKDENILKNDMLSIDTRDMSIDRIPLSIDKNCMCQK